jgi:hypothetical protein
LLRGEDRLAGRRGGWGVNILEDERNRIALLQWCLYGYSYAELLQSKELMEKESRKELFQFAGNVYYTARSVMPWQLKLHEIDRRSCKECFTPM